MIDTIVSNCYNVSIHRQLSLISWNLHCQVIEKPIGYESRGFMLGPALAQLEFEAEYSSSNWAKEIVSLQLSR